MTSNATAKHDGLHPRDALQASGDILVAPPFQAALNALSLTSLDAIFAFDGGKDLAKSNIGTHRRRFQLETTLPGATRPTKLYLKRYERPLACNNCDTGSPTAAASAPDRVNTRRPAVWRPPERTRPIR